MSLEEVQDYLEACGYGPEDLISVSHKLVSGGLKFRILPRDAAAKMIDGMRYVDCWLSAGTLRMPEDAESRGTAADVVSIPALWADLDVGEGKLPSYKVAREVIAEISQLIGAEPVALVASGHGLQPRWLLDYNVDVANEPEAWADLIARFGVTVQRIARAHGGKADSVYDLARIIRAPGTTNCKEKTKKVPVQLKLNRGADAVHTRDLERVLDSIDVVAPVVAPAADGVPATVDFARGNAYTKAAVEEVQRELRSIHDWPLGKTDDRGRGWEKLCADAAYRLAQLAKADWNQLSLQRAQEYFVEASPTDDGAWSIREVIKKWQSQVKRAEPSPPPPTVTDPLAPGYGAGGASPHAGAADAEGEGGGGAANQAGLRPGLPSDDPSAGELNGSGQIWRKYTWDDRGNAERMAALFGEELRWVPELKSWLRYADGAWRESDAGGVKAAMEMVDRMLKLELSLYSDVERREGRRVTSDRIEFGEWWAKQRFYGKYRDAARTLADSGLLSAPLAEFDTEPMLLNASNVVVDLRTGGSVPHDPELLLRRQVPVAYDPLAEAPMWEAFIAKVMPSADMRDYLQRATGYTLTGDVSSSAVFLHHGVTHNGKSVYLKVLAALMGELGRVIPPTTLLTKRNEAHPTDIMGMEGRRFLQVSELPKGARLEEATIKRLSGDDVITARGMGQDFRDFSITGKIHMVTNHFPHIDNDPATHRRIHVVTWGVSISEEEKDPYLARKIIQRELPGVLAWAVRGALKWKEHGMAKPVQASIASAEYFASEDEFADFMDMIRPTGDGGTWTPTDRLFIRYAQHTESMRGRPMSKIAFARELSSRGIQPVRTKKERGFRCELLDSHADADPIS